MTYKESLETAFRYADSQESDFDYKEMFYTLADEAQKTIALLNYLPTPKNIDASTSDDYEYEIPEYMQIAIPYYIAYRLVGTDDTTLYTALKNEWEQQLSFISSHKKATIGKIINVYGR